MGRAVGSWPRRLLLLPPQPGKASRSIWAVDARAEVLEVGTHDGQSGSMLAGVEIAHIQPAHAHLVGVVGAGRGGAWHLAGTTYRRLGPCHGVCVSVRGRVATVLRYVCAVCALRTRRCESRIRI